MLIFNSIKRVLGLFAVCARVCVSAWILARSYGGQVCWTILSRGVSVDLIHFKVMYGSCIKVVCDPKVNTMKLTDESSATAGLKISFPLYVHL